MTHDALALLSLVTLAGITGWLVCNQMYIYVDRQWMTPPAFRRMFLTWGGLLVLAALATLIVALAIWLPAAPRPLPDPVEIARG